MKLAGEHIFVAGGAVGVGAAIVTDAAAQGAKVSFIDIDESAGEKLAAELSSNGSKVAFAKADVANFAELAAAYKELVSKYGDVTGVVNNTG
ncbi:MAG: SDR family NAD(P)-dependent oxidoreductase, partial [Actinobacteria bacterium]|nr:SDR family NAD(P)-dependent oxidoreductase [Actinomycetota bacterium]